MNKKLTKKQKKEMLFNATMIAEGAKEPTPDMSYVQAWQHLVEYWRGVETSRLVPKGKPLG